MSQSTALARHLRELTTTQGRRAGKPFQVFPWERNFVRYAFKAGVSDAGLSMARGCGKTTFISGVGTGALWGPLVQPRADVIIVASSFEQARVDFEHCLAFTEARFPDLYESKRWRIENSSNRASIQDKTTGARIKCIGSDPARAHGLAGALYVLDEPAQWPRSTRDRMYAAIATSRGKIPGSRLVAVGTRSNDPEHFFSKLLSGGADYAKLYAAPSDADPFDVASWHAANPSLKYLPDLRKQIAKEAEKAKQDPALLAQFRALRLNMGVSDVVLLHLLDAGVWQAVEGNRTRGGHCVWGIDLGDGVAQSAITSYWESGRLESLAAFPSEPDLEKRSLKDGVGSGSESLYFKMHQRGELLLTQGQVVRVKDLLNAAYDRFGQPDVIAADRWKERDLCQSLEESKIEVCPISFRGQGFKDGAEDVRRFKQAVLDGRVAPEVSLLLRSGMAEAMVTADASGNQKLAKATEGGRRKNARDDAVAAAILAVAEMERRRGIVLEESEDTESDAEPPEEDWNVGTVE